jgi:hypothetical protein
MTNITKREIYCRVEYLDHDYPGLTLSIDGDSRTESWETLVVFSNWGAFEDIEGFDDSDERILKAVDAGLDELRAPDHATAQGLVAVARAAQAAREKAEDA